MKCEFCKASIPESRSQNKKYYPRRFCGPNCRTAAWNLANPRNYASQTKHATERATNHTQADKRSSGRSDQVR